jgi:hypothetical protein
LEAGVPQTLNAWRNSNLAIPSKISNNPNTLKIDHEVAHDPKVIVSLFKGDPCQAAVTETLALGFFK